MLGIWTFQVLPSNKSRLSNWGILFCFVLTLFFLWMGQMMLLQLRKRQQFFEKKTIASWSFFSHLYRYESFETQSSAFGNLHLSKKWSVASNARISKYDGKSFSEMIFRVTYLLHQNRYLEYQVHIREWGGRGDETRPPRQLNKTC